MVGGLAGGKVAGPFPVKRGSRTVTVSEGDETLVTSKVSLPAGSNSEIVVHLPASPTGDPMITRFETTWRPSRPVEAAHSVAHVAAAGPVDIRVNENVVSANVANGEYTYKVVPAGTRNVDIVQTGMSEPLLGPLDMTLEPAMMTWVFAIGVPGKDLAILRHVISLEAPRGRNARPSPHRHGRPGRRAGGQESTAGSRSAATGGTWSVQARPKAPLPR